MKLFIGVIMFIFIELLNLDNSAIKTLTQLVSSFKHLI